MNKVWGDIRHPVFVFPQTNQYHISLPILLLRLTQKDIKIYHT